MINVGLIGCGYWGSNLCRVLAQHPRTTLQWVCDPSPTALKRARLVAPHAKQTSEIEAVLADPGVDALVVATPVDSHFDNAIAALRAGKHVLLEKPLCRSVGEAEKLCAEAENVGRILMVGHTFLYNGAVRRVKAMIQDGDLGNLRYIFSRRLNLGIVRQDVDALWSLAPHDLAIFNYWVEKPVTDVIAVGHSFLQPGIADVVFAHLTYEGGIAAHIQLSWLDPSKVRQITVVGSRRMLVYDDMSAEARIAVYDKGIDVSKLDANLGRVDTYAEHQLRVRAGDVWLPKVDYKEPLVEEIEEFAASISDGRKPLTDGRSGLAVVALLERLTVAMRGNTRS